MTALDPNFQIQSNGAINPVPVLMTGLGVILVAFLIVMIGVVVGVRGPDVNCLLLAALAIVIGFVPIAFDMGRPRFRRHVFLSMLAMVYTIGYVMPVFVHYIPAVGPMDPPAMNLSNLTPMDVATGQWVAIVGLLSLYAGYALPIGQFARAVLPRQGYEWTLGASLTATTLLVALGWLIFLASGFGMIPSFLGSGVLGAISKATTFGSALLMATYLKHRSRFAVVMLVVLIPITTLINFMTGSKQRALLPVAMIVLTWVISERRIRMRWMVTGLLAVVLIYPVARFWRGDVLEGNTLSLGQVLRDPLPALSRTSRFLASGRVSDYMTQGLESTARRLDSIGVTSVIVRDTPSVSPFQNGRTLALIPIAYIPRIFWPGKPQITIGDWVSDTYVRDGFLVDNNLGSTWVGEFYLNRGVPVVIAGMIAMGFFLRVVHETLMRPGASIPMITAAVIVMSTTPLALQGGVVMGINAPIFMFIPLAGMHMLVRLMGGVTRIDLDEEKVDSAAA